MKSNLGIYVSQLKVQRYNKSSKIQNDAVELLNLLSKRIGKNVSKMSVDELNSIPFDINQKSAEHKKYWGSTGMFSYEESAHFLGFFGKKHRETRKKFFKGVGKGIANIGKTLAHIVTAPTILPLLPFISGMKKELRRRGKSPKNWPQDLAIQFYKEVIQKHNYEGYEAYYTDLGMNEAGFILPPIGEIIKAIINFFKMLGKKASDGSATPEEQALVQDVASEQEKISKDPEYKAKLITDSSFAKSEKPALSPVMMIIYAVLGIIILKKVL